MQKKTGLAVFLILALSLVMLVSVETEAETEYVLQLQGPTWDNSLITVLVLPEYDEPWWKPFYLNAALRAINQWNEAISSFASNQSDFAYLLGVRFVPQVSNSTREGFDSTTSWIEQFGNETCEAGLSRTTHASNLIIDNSLTLAAYDCRGNMLSEGDMQNVVLHELGHCLGLGHTNSTGDLMYFAYTLGGSVRAISTLDVYGVGVVFRWMAFSAEYDMDNQGPAVYSVTLPPGITYEHVATSEENLPPPTPVGVIRTYFSEFLRAVTRPEGIAIMIMFTVAVVTVYVIVRRRRGNARSGA